MKIACEVVSTNPNYELGLKVGLNARMHQDTRRVDVLDEVEKALLLQAMKVAGGNQSMAARVLGTTRYALRYRLAKHKIAFGADGAQAQ